MEYSKLKERILLHPLKDKVGDYYKKDRITAHEGAWMMGIPESQDEIQKNNISKLFFRLFGGKSSHGGKRKGAGRKPHKKPTT